MQSSWVVKLGGSLMQSRLLPIWLDRLQKYRHRGIVIVPGGGIFADHVRQLQHRWCFDDDVAHKLALRAMEQYALVLQALAGSLTVTRTRSEIEKAVTNGETALWFPWDMVADNRELAASWDITSDSLALWLAGSLQYQNLLLVKSVTPPECDFSAQSLSGKGYLDDGFPGYLRKNPVNVWLMAVDQYERLDTLIGGHEEAAVAGRITI